jgi:ligand-binding sensor domain-containing protein
MQREIKKVLVWMALMALSPRLGGTAQSAPDVRIRGTNRHYRSGDWGTWSSTRHIRHICLSADRVYFATTGGITCFNPFSQRWEEPFTVSSGLASADAELVAYDENSGFLWCVQSEGISYLGPASQAWTNLFYDEIGFSRDERATSLGFGSDRKVYLPTNTGRLFAAYGTNGQFEAAPEPGPDIEVKWFGEREAKEPPPPYLFLPQGFWYDEQARVISDIHSRKFPLTFWLRDPWHNLWISTWGLGAARVDLLSSRYQPLPFGLWDDAVDYLAYDQNALWLGGEQKHEGPAGLTKWEVGSRDPEYFEPRFITGFSDDRITAMAFDDNHLWFGTKNGLTRYDLNKRIWRTYSEVDHLSDPRITDLYLDSLYIWVASEAGLSRIKQSTVGKKDSLAIEIIDYRNLGRLSISNLAACGDTLWVGSEYGLYFYDMKADSGAFWRGGFFQASQAIEAVACYANEVWFGTGQGIAGFDARTGEWFAPPAQRLESSGRINWMDADEYSVWVACEQGVLRYDRAGKRWIHYTMEDGLPAQEINSLLLAGDYIWFGSSSGLTLFYWNAPYRID